MRTLRAIIVLLLVTAVAKADDVWHLTKGDPVTGKLAAVYGSLAVISRPDGSSVVPLTLLGDAELERVADYVAAEPSTPVKWSESQSVITRTLRWQLQSQKDGALTVLNPGDRPEPAFYVLYYGARWSEPCREFTPELLAAYHRLQEAAPGVFEVIFVSVDRDAVEQLDDIRNVNMPWAILNYESVGATELVDRWASKNIPNLVVLTPNGDLVFHSYPEGDAMNGPRHILQHIEELIANVTNTGATKRALHRIEVARHVRSAPNGTAAVEPYLVSLDPAKYPALQNKMVTATLDIDDFGHVTAATVDSSANSELNAALATEAKQWLFLPAVTQGHARPIRIKLPLDLKS